VSSVGPPAHPPPPVDGPLHRPKCGGRHNEPAPSEGRLLSSIKHQTSQFIMEMYYIVMQTPRWLLCERAVRTIDGYLLYEYVPDDDIYTDSGYAKNLEDLQFMMSFRYGVKSELLLVRSFEETARLFAMRKFPKIIHLARADVFCTRRGDILLNIKWDYDADGHFFVKKMEWRLGSSPPRSLKDALERLSDYAKKRGVWIVLRETIKEATAYEVYP
jgi:hypothetical protein